MKYEVKGRIQLGRINQSFTKEIEAENEELAKTLVLSNFGGKYRINSRKIKIEEVARKGAATPQKAVEKSEVEKEDKKPVEKEAPKLEEKKEEGKEEKPAEEKPEEEKAPVKKEGEKNE